MLPLLASTPSLSVIRGVGWVFSRQISWGAGVGVVLAAVNGAVINELHGGWPWLAVAGVLTVTGAVLAGWLAAGSSVEDVADRSVEVGAGAVYVGGTNAGNILTAGPPRSGRRPGWWGRRVWRRVVAGGVFVGRGNTKTAVIDTTGRSAEPKNSQ
jgi:hypothetical protein